MNVDFRVWSPPTTPSGLLAVGLPFGTSELPGELAGLPQPLLEPVRRVLADGSFRGRTGDCLVVHGADADATPSRVALVGLGSAGKLDAEAVRRGAGSAIRAAERLGVTSLSYLVLPAGRDAGEPEAVALRAAAEGAVLAGWDYRDLKGPPPSPEKAPPELVASVVILGLEAGDAAEAAVRTGAIVAAAENEARALQAAPGNLMTPTILAEAARDLADASGLSFRALGPAEMEEEGMGALLAVAAGSTEEPRLIVLEHRGGEEEAPLVLVGKGLTFDAGGISIKPSLNMDEMKFDMSGGAAVIAAMSGIAHLGVKRNVIGVVPSSENLPDGKAVKPGDVVTTRSGKTVAVLNTDAEGRLILADALSYAVDMEPEAIVDCATLTGAVVIALGHVAAAALGTDQTLVDEIIEAGERTGERCWQLPLWSDYRKQLNHEVADLRNIGGRPAGTITAACFLREFVGETPWVHLDIAGTAYGKGDRSYRRRGGFGVPTRLLIEWVCARAAGRG